MADVVRSDEVKAKSSQEDWTWQRRLVSYPIFCHEWDSSRSWKQKWISDTSRVRDRRTGFLEHLAMYSSLKGISGSGAARP